MQFRTLTDRLHFGRTTHFEPIVSEETTDVAEKQPESKRQVLNFGYEEYFFVDAYDEEKKDWDSKKSLELEKEFFPIAIEKISKYGNNLYTEHQPDPEKTPGLAEAYADWSAYHGCADEFEGVYYDAFISYFEDDTYHYRLNIGMLLLTTDVEEATQELRKHGFTGISHWGEPCLDTEWRAKECNIKDGDFLFQRFEGQIVSKTRIPTEQKVIESLRAIKPLYRKSIGNWRVREEVETIMHRQRKAAGWDNKVVRCYACGERHLNYIPKPCFVALNSQITDLSKSIKALTDNL